MGCRNKQNNGTKVVAPILWLTGLPCSGKSTLAHVLVERLEHAGMRAFNVDTESRDLSGQIQAAEIASTLSSKRIWPIVSAMASTEELRHILESKIGDIIWIYVNTSQQICEQRMKAIGNFFGINEPYVPPADPDIIVSTHANVASSVDQIWHRLTVLGTLPTNRKLWYESVMRNCLGSKFYPGYSLTQKGATYLRKHARSAKSILECGVGYSTLIIESTKPFVHVAGEHDDNWSNTMRELLELGGLNLPLMYSMEQIRKHGCKEMFDLVFVDHGPTMDTRLKDIPFLVEATKKGGILLFDDCRPTTRYRSRLQAKLLTLGLKLLVPEASGPERRRFGVARRI